MVKIVRKTKNRFKFLATVSDRGQIFIPKALQNYFGIQRRDKVAFIVDLDGDVVFKKGPNSRVKKGD